MAYLETDTLQNGTLQNSTVQQQDTSRDNNYNDMNYMWDGLDYNYLFRNDINLTNQVINLERNLFDCNDCTLVIPENIDIDSFAHSITYALACGYLAKCFEKEENEAFSQGGERIQREGKENNNRELICERGEFVKGGVRLFKPFIDLLVKKGAKSELKLLNASKFISKTALSIGTKGWSEMTIAKLCEGNTKIAKSLCVKLGLTPNDIGIKIFVKTEKIGDDIYFILKNDTWLKRRMSSLKGGFFVPEVVWRIGMVENVKVVYPIAMRKSALALKAARHLLYGLATYYVGAMATIEKDSIMFDDSFSVSANVDNYQNGWSLMFQFGNEQVTIGNMIKNNVDNYIKLRKKLKGATENKFLGRLDPDYVRQWFVLQLHKPDDYKRVKQIIDNDMEELRNSTNENQNEEYILLPEEDYLNTLEESTETSKERYISSIKNLMERMDYINKTKGSIII